MDDKVQTSQKAHYDKIAISYAKHAGEKYSQIYRKKFIYEQLFKDSDLNQSLTLEAMCGAGEATSYLQSKNADVVGLDISIKELLIFKEKFPKTMAVCSSAITTCFADDRFDKLVVIGSLHHLHPNVDEALIDFHRILKKGGEIFLYEPHQGSIPDFFRKLWYRFDNLFLKNERSLDIEDMLEKHSDKYSFEIIGYFGNIAYLFIYNSLIFRMPLFIKRIYSPLFLKLESFFNKFQNKRFSCFVLIRARKK